MKADILNEGENTFFFKLDFFRIGSIALAVLVLTMLTLPEIIRAEGTKNNASELTSTSLDSDKTPAKKLYRTSKIYSKKEAYRASGERDKKTFKIKNPKIVLHYGEGIIDADLLAEVLRERSYPAVAYPGGPDGLIEIMVGRGIVGTYDQRALDRGTVGGISRDIYNSRFGKPVKSQKASLSGSRD